MKQQTADKLRSFLPRFQFDFTEKGLEINHDLTDSEILDIVEQEYGTNPQNVDSLFHIIMKKAVKLAVENAKV